MATKKQVLEKLTSAEGSIRRGEKDAALLKTKQGKEMVATLREPAPSQPPPPPPPVSSMIVGLDAGSYGPEGARDVRACVPHVRCDVERGSGTLRNFHDAGLKSNLNFSGPYASGGVSSLDADAWVRRTVEFFKANTNPSLTPIIEVLNEPGGTWFWGGNAANQQNADAYRNLLRLTHSALHAEYGEVAPKVLGTLDGSGGLDFGQRWWNADCTGFVDGVIVHPYGGTGSRSSSALGNRQKVEEAHTLSGVPVYVTEVGWPSGAGKVGPTGDSLQWTEAEQAENLTNFIGWCRGAGYVREVVYFNYRDFGGSNLYGVVRGDGSHKPAYDALKSVVSP